MATKLKVVEDVADIVPAPTPPEFDIAPTRKQHAGWTAERQRRFIEHLSLTGNVGEACAVVGVASSWLAMGDFLPPAASISDLSRRKVDSTSTMSCHSSRQAV